jgi:DNA-binding transcriptional LysR family regulator
LYVFARIAHHGSFTRAAAELGTSASALSQTMRTLERRMGLQLLNRTTRNVRLTEHGARFHEQLLPGLNQIENAVAALDESRVNPAGVLRINLPRIAATLLVMPMLDGFQRAYPNIRVELAVREEFVDVVAGGYDAGIRLGESVDKDMIAVRVSADERMAVVGSPAYFAMHGRPASPEQLHAHRCICFRFTGSGALYRWEFERDGRALATEPEGPLIVNDNDLMIEAAKRGLGLAFVFRSSAAADLASGALEEVMPEWSTQFPGFFLYYPRAAAAHRQMPLKLRVFIEALQARMK